MAAGFLLLAAGLGRSGARFLGSYVAGVLLRLAAAGGTAGLAAAGVLEAVPALAALAFTYAGLLAVECAVLGAAGR
jgi:hypothetical protein